MRTIAGAVSLVLLVTLAGCADSPRNLGNQAVARADYAAAETYYTSAAQQGDAGGMTGLGYVAQKRGQMDAAIRWYTLAARYGEPTAILNLTKLGKPVPHPDLQGKQVVCESQRYGSFSETVCK
jgi:hypothetical protein